MNATYKGNDMPYDQRRRVADALLVLVQETLGLPRPGESIARGTELSANEALDINRMLMETREGIVDARDRLSQMIDSLMTPTTIQVAQQNSDALWNQTEAAAFAGRTRRALRARSIPLKRMNYRLGMPLEVRRASGIVGAFVVHMRGKNDQPDRVTITAYGKGATQFLMNLLKNERVRYDHPPAWCGSPNRRKADVTVTGLIERPARVRA